MFSNVCDTLEVGLDVAHGYRFHSFPVVIKVCVKVFP